MKILAALLLFSLLILSHELGHFLAAKFCGVRVESFNLGLGPRLWSWRRQDTTYALRLLPIGGSVQMLGEDGESCLPGSFQGRPLWQRLLVLAAGPLSNFLLALLLFTLVFLVWGTASGTESPGLLRALGFGLQQSWWLTRELLVLLGGMLTGQVTPDLVGPVALVGMIGQAAGAGLRTVLLCAAYLSVNLGLMNLLPFPALDGGRMAFLLMEGLRGRALDPRQEGLVHLVGFVLLCSLLVVVTWQDMLRLIA